MVQCISRIEGAQDSVMGLSLLAGVSELGRGTILMFTTYHMHVVPGIRIQPQHHFVFKTLAAINIYVLDIQLFLIP